MYIEFANCFLMLLMYFPKQGYKLKELTQLEFNDKYAHLVMYVS